MRRRLDEKPATQTELPVVKSEAKEAFENARKHLDEIPPPPPPVSLKDEVKLTTVPELPQGVDRIRRTIFEGPELDEEFTELRNGLQFKDRASSKSQGEIQDALDRSTENAQRAAELLARVKVTHEKFESYAALTEAGIRERAQAELNRQKESGKYNGRFSQADVESMMASLAADEYSALSVRRAEVKRMIDTLEALASNWIERTRNLRAMLSMGRGA